MKTSLSNLKTFYFSIAGKKHLANNQKNEDSCLVAKINGGTVFALADGVGSCKFPSYASSKAVKAIVKTARHFSGVSFNDEEFIKYFEKKFKCVPWFLKKGMSTTLIFVILYDNNKIVLGQAGDGLLYTSFNGKSAVFKKKNDDFTNVTNALNAARKYKGWIFRQKIVEKTGNFSFFACSDGLSEDLIENNYDIFLRKIISDIDSTAGEEIKNIMNNWPVKGSNDDKSLFAGYCSFNKEEMTNE